jgi:hypothetical protein
LKSAAASAFVVAACVCMSMPALGQTAERPEWRYGDTWIYRQHSAPPPADTEWSRKVVDPMPYGLFQVQTEAGKYLKFDSEGNSLDGRGEDYSWRRFNFPLTVGKTWKHERKIAGDTWNGNEQSSWTVKAHEKVTVPAGTFDCFRVEGEAHATWASGLSLVQNFNRRLTLTTYWYCPEVKWSAKWVIEDQAYASAARTFTTSELVRFERAP